MAKPCPRSRGVFSPAAFLFLAGFSGAAVAQTPEDAPAAPVAAPNLTPSPDQVRPVQPAAEPARPKKQSAQETTGSRVRRQELTTAAPVAVISREEIEQSGVASIGELLFQIPQQTGALNTNVNNGGTGETQISLRGLGPALTLVMVDGKRWVNGASAGVGSAVDLSSIPTAAVERIEILKDGASAIYGSDAVGGVVNIITRKSFDGTEASVYFGASPHGDGQQYDVNVSSGMKSDKGSFFFTGGYYDAEPILAGNRDWAKTAIGVDFEECNASGTCPATNSGNFNFPAGSPFEQKGGSSTIPQGKFTFTKADQANLIANCTTSFCTAIASAFFNTGKTVALIYDPTSPQSVQGYRPYNSQTDVNNYQAASYLTTPQKRVSLFANGDYHLSDSVRAYVQASFLNKQTSNLIASEPLITSNFGGVVSKDNEFNPFGIDLNLVQRRLVETGGRSQQFDLDTFRGEAGIDGTLPAAAGPLHGLFWDLSYSFGRTAGTTDTSGSLNTLFINNGIGPSYQDANGNWQCGTNPATGGNGPIPDCTPVDLLHGPGSLTPAMLQALGGYKGINQGFNQLSDLQFNTSDQLFHLFSERPAAVAAGYEYRAAYGGYFPNAIAQSGLDTDYNSQATTGSYHVNEGYGELSVPILSNAFLVNDLEVSVAARVSNYSTFGTDGTYKLGGRWRPIRDVTLRGTLSTAFHAPDIADLYGGQAASAEPATDPCSSVRPGSTLEAQCKAQAVRQGTTPNLVAGCDPSGNNCTCNDASCGGSQINSTIGGNANLQPEKANIGTLGIVLEPQRVKGLSLTLDYYHIYLYQALGFNTTGIILAGCYPASVGSNAAQNQTFCNQITRSPTTGLITNVLDLEANVGSTETQGVDMTLRYSLPTSAGRFGFIFDGNYLVQYDIKISSGKIYKSAGNYDAGSASVVSFLTPTVRFNTALTYGIAGFTAGVTGHFIGNFRECPDASGLNNAFGGQVGECADGNQFTDANGNPTGVLYPYHEVPAYMTFDLFASYAFHLPFGVTTVSAGIHNIADTDPPRVYNSFLTYADPGYDFVGRFLYARMAQKF